MKDHSTFGKSKLGSWFNFLLLTLIFGLSYGQYPLFYHTQNQYFFYGLANLGFGQLSRDWFAHTPDPWPVFTLLVEFTYRYLDPRFFYLYFIGLAGVYAFSLLGIVSFLFRIDRSKIRFFAFLILVVALHSPAFGYLGRIVVGLPLTSSPHHFNVGRILLLEGVGEKRILGDMLSPATFGAFLLLSIYLFLRGRPFLAATSSGVAAAFHPSYLLPAGILTLSYMIIMLRRGEGFRKPIGLGLYALVLVLPEVAYDSIMFRPTDPAIWKASQDILVRIAYYPPAIPQLWLGTTVYIKMAMVLVALYLVRRTQLFWVILLAFFAATGLTLVQMLTGNTTLALLLPWRISAFLVPMATLIILGYGFSRLMDAFEARYRSHQSGLLAVGVVSLVVLVGAGVLETVGRFNQKGDPEAAAVMRSVGLKLSPNDTYLIPVSWRYFRLATGAAVFAERSVIPYNDAGVMEWYRRERLAEAFYGSAESSSEEDYVARSQPRLGRPPQSVRARALPEPSPQERCQLLKELSATYGVTHVVLSGGGLDGCKGWELAFSNPSYRIYAATH